MGRFVEGQGQRQQSILPACLEDYAADDNAVRGADASTQNSTFPLSRLRIRSTSGAGPPDYHPATPLEIYLRLLDRIQSSPRLEREAIRNVEISSLGFLAIKSDGYSASPSSGIRRFIRSKILSPVSRRIPS